MADLPDYYTQTAISEAEAASFKGGLDANKSAAPVSRQIYYATDSKILYVCVVDGTWININALYLLLAGGTMTGNIAMGGNKVTGLGAPAAQDDALRYNRAEIRNAEIAAGAAIAYAKLALTGAIKAADIEAAAGIPLTKLEDAVCSETEADTIAAALIAAIHPDAVAGDRLETSNDDAYTFNHAEYFKEKEIRIARAGAYRIKFDIKLSTNGGHSAYGQIYRNGGAVGTEQIEAGTSFVTKSEDISGWAVGDLLQLYVKNGSTGAVENLRLYTDNPILNYNDMLTE